MLFKRKQIPFPIPDGARELTDAEMILVNGGAKIENSVEAQANAQEGDTVTRKDGSTYTLTKGDIVWAQNQVGNGGASAGASVVPETGISSVSDVCSNSSGCISGSRCPPNSSGTSVPRSTSSSFVSTTNTGNDCTANILKDQKYHSPYDQQFINEMMEKEQKIALGSNGVSGNKDESASASAVSFDFKNNGYPDFVDTANGIVYADKRSRKSMEEACAAYSVLCYKGYTFKVTDGVKVTDTFKSESAAKKYVNDLYPAKGNLSEMLGNVSTNTGIANVTADKIIDYADDAASFTKLAKYSGGASKTSSITGIAATVIDTGHLFMNPSFHNFSSLTSDAVGFIPDVGPFASIGVSYASEKVEDAAQAGIQTASIGLQYEHRINSVMGNNSSVLLGDNMDSGYIVKSYCLQWLDWFFGKE